MVSFTQYSKDFAQYACCSSPTTSLTFTVYLTHFSWKWLTKSLSTDDEKCEEEKLSFFFCINICGFAINLHTLYNMRDLRIESIGRDQILCFLFLLPVSQCNFSLSFRTGDEGKVENSSVGF